MPYSIPSRDDIHKVFLDEARGQLPEKNQSRGSDLYRLGRVVSGVAWMIVARISTVVSQLLPDQAKGAWQDRWGAIIDVPRRVAGPSQGTAALLVTGTPATPVPSGLGNELAHADGTLYQITTVGAVLDGGGNATVSVLAVSTGVQTNKRTGDTLTFVAPPPGINGTATLTADLVDGVDIEGDEELRPRQLDYFAAPPEGGDPSDYVQWALRVPGIAWAGVMPLRSGLGTVDMAVLGPGSGAARILGDTSAALAYIQALLPAGMKPTAFQLLTVTAVPQDVTIYISIDSQSGFKWDWDDGGVGTAIVAASSVASTITLGAVPAGLTAGKRITVDGEEALVTNIVGLVLTLSFTSPATWFSYGDPTGLDVRASGDLVVPVRKAIAARFDQLGPARSTYSFGVWDDTLRIAKLEASAIDVAGVQDAHLVTPAANVANADSGGATILLITPRRIRVWKQT